MAQSPVTPATPEGSVPSSRSGSPNLSISESPLPVEVEHPCPLCDNKLQDPRILSCLHVFCMQCLEKQVEDLNGQEDEDGMGAAGGGGGGDGDHPLLGEVQVVSERRPRPIAGTIICSICKQETKLQGKGVEDLPVDIVLAQMLDKNGSADLDIICTSCKARENAVARCSDCANFLCPACVTAHQYMRCFENHKVVSFEDMQDGEGMELQKPMFCSVHITENLKYFCEACQGPICQECTTTIHAPPAHTYEKITDVESKCRDDLKTMITESKGKIQFCEQASSSLEGGLSDLQMQRDNARGLIEETFQTYRTILEKVQSDLVRDLELNHHKQELNIMDMFHNIEKTTERIEDGCTFAERVLEHGNPVQLMIMKKLVSSQLLLLINNTPKPDVNIKIDFVSNQEAFENAMKQTFGRLEIKSANEPETKSEDDEIEIDDEIPKVSLPEDVPDLVSGTLTIPPGLMGPHSLPSVSGATDFLAGIPPLSLTNIASLASSISVATESIPSMASTMPNLSSERSSSRNSYSPAMSDSGISVDAASTSSATAQPMVNVAGLSKIGTVGVNSQGQITLNNQPLPGLTVNNVTGLPQALSNRTHTPTPSQSVTDTACISNLLNSVSLGGGGGGGSRSHTPQLSDIPGLAGLLGQPSALNGIAGMNPITGASGLLGPQLPSPGVHGLGALQGNLSLSTPPPLTPTYCSGSGSSMQQPPFPTRSSGKMSAMQIRQLGLNSYDDGDLAPNLLDGFRYLNGAYGAASSGLFLGPRCKFGQLGPGKGQFNSPHGFCLGFEEDIIVADTNNHRVQVFEKTGEFKYQFGIPGREEGQLWYPRKVAVIRHTGRYVVCDRGNERSRMQIFNKVGHFIKKIAIRYIDIVAGLAITSQGNIVAVDSVSPTVFCIEETGNLLKWFDCSDYMREPSDIAVAGKEYFVCDFKGHCVVVFNEDGQFLRRIGCESITNFPNGIDISDAGDVLVGDSHGNRFHVAVFQRDGSLIGEFECPYVKVSRCCGLRITSEGYVVTLAKNNHHVLVLNTLYIA